VKTLLDVHIRYSRVIVFVLLGLFSALALSEGSVLTKEDRAIAKNANTFRALSENWKIPINENEKAAKLQATRLFTELQKETSKLINLPSKKKPSGRVVFFASLSLGPEGLDDVIYAASKIPDSMVVFRGVRDVNKFAKSVFEIQSLAGKQSPMANVLIDPTLYRDYGITKVPTILYLNEEKTSEVARVAGLSNAEWLIRNVNAGNSGDLGVRGPVEDILEKDLIEVMQNKVAGINWVEKKENAIKRFWERQEFIELPRAPKSRRRYLDPSIIITNDIRDAAGNIIVFQGTSINPLELRSFTQAVVVFDPLDSRQLALVDEKLPELIKNYPRVTLIVTRFDRAEGWESYKSITDHFDAPVFKLTSDIYSRFDLEFTPVVITANKNHFIIDELAFTEEEAN